MSVLHIVNKSPFDRNSLDTCLRLALEGCAILLIEDGVYAASSRSSIAGKVEQAMQKLPVYALQADLQARGIAQDSVISGIELVDYDGFVGLVAEYEKTQSWL